MMNFLVVQGATNEKPQAAQLYRPAMGLLELLLFLGVMAAALAGTSRSAMAQSPPAAASRETADAQHQSAKLNLEMPIERHTGDLDDMIKRRTVRALVVLDPISFFYDEGKPRGIMYEALDAFQQFINQKLNPGSVKIEVTFVPRTPAQIEAALQDGVGDLVAYGVIVTPDRDQRAAFSIPIQQDAADIVVTGKKDASISSFDDLAGRSVYVNPLSAHRQNLQNINGELTQRGKQPIKIREADPNLTDSDLLEMVNAGLIPATVVLQERAALWAQLLPNITLHNDMVVAGGQQLAWVMRKNNPELKALVDEFVKTRMAGTSFGNTLLHRYMQNVQWLKSATSQQEKEKFDALVSIFQKYGQQYDFDFLMLAAQGYQESQLDQNRRSPGGIGIMQVNPRIAAVPPISIRNVNEVDGNIHAAAKMMRQIADKYFNDAAIDPANRTFLVFASYNAGPNRIKRLRELTKEAGLNPNLWFGNVELLAAKEIGQVTVSYVRNIYKYYIAYKMAAEQSALN